jgi:hypothetical protein
MAKQGENTTGPSYTSQSPVFRENKSLKRETRAMNGDGGSGAVKYGQNSSSYSKGQRKTGKV